MPDTPLGLRIHLPVSIELRIRLHGALQRSVARRRIRFVTQRCDCSCTSLRAPSFARAIAWHQKARSCSQDLSLRSHRTCAVAGTATLPHCRAATTAAACNTSRSHSPISRTLSPTPSHPPSLPTLSVVAVRRVVVCFLLRLVAARPAARGCRFAYPAPSHPPPRLPSSARCCARACCCSCSSPRTCPLCSFHCWACPLRPLRLSCPPSPFAPPPLPPPLSARPPLCPAYWSGGRPPPPLRSLRLCRSRLRPALAPLPLSRQTGARQQRTTATRRRLHGARRRRRSRPASCTHTASTRPSASDRTSTDRCAPRHTLRHTLRHTHTQASQRGVR